MPPDPTPKSNQSPVERVEPTPPTARLHWGTSRTLFRALLLFFLLGASVAWYRDWSMETGAWLVLREEWHWPRALATTGSAAYYAVSALLSSFFLGVWITSLIDVAKNAYRWLRRRS